MIAVEEAHAAVIRWTPMMPVVCAPTESVVGQVLAEDVLAEAELPPCDTADLDGYALRSTDIGELPAELELLDEPAGRRARELALGPRQCVRVLPGEAMPGGADRVVALEDAEGLPGSRLRVLRANGEASNIRQRGKDCQPGHTVLKQGRLMRPPEIFLLAEMGKSTVLVRRRPSVAVLAVGGRLVPLGQRPGPGQLYSSNLYSLAALCCQMRIPVSNLGLCPYDSDELTERLQASMAEHDAIIVSGGLGLGSEDLLPTTISRLGFAQHFCRLAMSPGDATLFATKGSTVLFGLPGSPLSLFASFLLFVRLALKKMMGHEDLVPDVVVARLRREVRNRSERKLYAPARLFHVGERWEVAAVPCHGASDPVALTRGDSLLVVPPDSTWPRGSSAQVIRLEA